MQRTASPQQPTAPTQTQLQPMCLLLMRMLSESPASTTPSLQQQPTPPSLSTTQHQQQQHPTMPITTTSRFACFATTHSGAYGFGKLTFGKSTCGGNPPTLMPM